MAWLAKWQTRRPLLVIALALLTLIPSGFAVSKLKLRTAFGELLPDDKPSVIELRRISERLASASTLTVVAESKDTALLKRWVEELTPKLRKLPSDWVTAVDAGPKEAQRFFEANKHLYASLADIQTLHDEVIASYDREVSKHAGLDLGLDDDDDEAEAESSKPIVAEDLEQRFDRAMADVRKNMPGQDGYYIGENGKLAAIFVRTTLPSMDTRVYELERRVNELVAQGDYRRVDPKFAVNFTGDLVTSAEQYRAVSDDLVTIGASGVLLVMAVVFLFFLRVRALVALGVAIGLGCTWSRAFAELSVGYLNTATGFLVSIIAGNGINAMVTWMARYIEARRDQKLDVSEAVVLASKDTCEATLAVVGVAMVSYGALMTTDFRGFRHFGIIGGAGMFLCWIACYAVLPAVIVLSERFRPLPAEATWRDRLAGLYGRPFAWIAKSHPAIVATLGIALGLVCTGASAKYFYGDPMEYDLRKILNDETSPTSAGELSARVNKVAGRINQGGRAVLVDRLDQIKPLVTELERRRDSAPADAKPFDKVVSVYSLLPQDQDKKIELLREVLDRVQRGRRRGFISDEQWQKLQAHIPSELRALRIEDLPELVARPFKEKNGDLGKIVYVSPTAGRSLNNAHYLMLWANSFRTVTLPNGDVIHGTGNPVVFSDMLINIGEDAPRVALTSLLGTLLVIMFAFRWRVAGVGAVLTLLLGVSWLVGSLYFSGTKLNFLNFVALPVAIGAGADYAINIMKRRELEGTAGIERAFIETGGAVVACSMTTLCGYLALLVSINGAVRSFGIAAATGEAATQLSAMLVLPAVLFWRRKRTAAATAQAQVQIAE